MNLENLKNIFIENFNENEEEIRIFFSPSRINIIGEHIDYNGGQVLPCALEIGTYGVSRKNNDNVLRLKSLNMDLEKEISLDDLEYKEDNSWINYVVGMTKYIKEAGYNIGGFDLLIKGNIPNGAGLSSSASLEILIGEILNSLYNDNKIKRPEMALLGQKTENQFLGINTGIMDQFIIANGKKNNALLLDTNSLNYEYIPFNLKNNKIVVLNTNKRRELKDSKYNERREECDEALEILSEYKEIENLCDLTEEDISLLEKIENEDVRNRAEHAILENARVIDATLALKNGDIETLGELLKESNDSLRELYEVSGKELDSITKNANSFPNCLGARMTGAGFGGCAIAIVKDDSIDEFKKHVYDLYKKDTGLEAEFIISNVGNSVYEIK